MKEMSFAFIRLMCSWCPKTVAKAHRDEALYYRSIRMLHIIVFFRMMFFIAVKEQGSAFSWISGLQKTRPNSFVNRNQKE